MALTIFPTSTAHSPILSTASVSSSSFPVYTSRRRTRSSNCLLEMEGVLDRIAGGDLTARLSCGRSGECGGACLALDGMSQRRSSQSGQQGAERQRANGQRPEYAGSQTFRFSQPYAPFAVLAFY